MYAEIQSVAYMLAFTHFDTGQKGKFDEMKKALASGKHSKNSLDFLLYIRHIVATY